MHGAMSFFSSLIGQSNGCISSQHGICKVLVVYFTWNSFTYSGFSAADIFFLQWYCVVVVAGTNLVNDSFPLGSNEAWGDGGDRAGVWTRVTLFCGSSSPVEMDTFYSCRYKKLQLMHDTNPPMLLCTCSWYCSETCGNITVESQYQQSPCEVATAVYIIIAV